MPRPSRRAVADRAATAILVAAVLVWSVLYAVLGQLLLRPVSTCGGPESRCAELVDLGVDLASWSPLVVAVVMLAAIGRRIQRGRATTPAAVAGVFAVLALQALGQAIIPLGIVPR